MITGIGSLPHHNVDAALAYSFQHDIPYLPQLTQKNNNEFMVQQALCLLPGLRPCKDFKCQINLKEWLQGRDNFKSLVSQEVEGKSSGKIDPAYWSAYQAFLYECEERQVKLAKVQIAGPLTVQMFTTLDDGEPIRKYNDLLDDCVHSVLTQALRMVRDLKERGITPLISLDEPALFAFDKHSAFDMGLLQELKLIIMTLKKEGAQVALHCCSNTQWDDLLKLPLDYLSFDAGLSFEVILQQSLSQLKQFIQDGGKLLLGVIPTNQNSQVKLAQGPDYYQELFQQKLSGRLAIQELILSPACGLGLKDPQEAELILSDLKGFQKTLNPLQ